MKETRTSAYYEYIKVDNADLFTVILLPDKVGKYPIVVIRNPYVDKYENSSEEYVVYDYLKEHETWLREGYAIIYQHCRGRGKSSGECIPYIKEREDGLVLLNWLRQQAFYKEEIYLLGESYTASVHYTTAPFADDIKGAIFGVQDTNRYNVCYRNGFLKKGLHGDWYVRMYKAKSHIKKNYTVNSFNILPLSDFTKTVFGESADDFDELLKHPDPDDEFWGTRYGGAETRNVTDNVKFPILFTSRFYDLYTGGTFDMWNALHEEGKKKSALVISPNDHVENSVDFKFIGGKIAEYFGEDYKIRWFNYIRGVEKKSPFELGKVTYYRLFENKWDVVENFHSSNNLKLMIGKEAVSYVYNPYDPPEFKGGLSRASGGSSFQDKPGVRYDIVTVYSEPFEQDVFVKGKISANLSVQSDCEDTCFYIRVSIAKEQGDFGLRDDITSLCFSKGSYVPGEIVNLEFDFDEHAFLIKKGEKIRIDISSADNAHYVRHTNTKGLYSEQKFAKVAHNTVYLQESYLILPTEAE
ncbi:MAG: CocE/NonD family hydrolase [Lachnospiraceae bacterium]|nr:CocE/NonD family hydrolase [Lachnospiraceae bacterium]